MRETARLVCSRCGKTIKVRSIPAAVPRAAGAVIGRCLPMVKDTAAMFRWFDTRPLRRRCHPSGPAVRPFPTAEDAIDRLTAELRTPRRT